MKTSLKLIFLDRSILILSSVAVLSFMFMVASSIYVKNTEGENTLLQTRLHEIEALAGNALEMKSIVDSREKKIGLRKTKGVVSTLEQILKDLGLTANAIKPLDRKKVNVFMEENAELEILNVDLNSVVNLLYKIEYSPVPMKIKKVSMNTTFENPDRFILKLTVSQLSRA